MTLSDAELEDLYRRYAGLLHARCRSILGSEEEASDAVQETFARVIRHHDTFREQSSPLTWMYQISTNWCLNQLRNRKGRSRKHEDHKHEIVGDGFVESTLELDDGVIRDLLADTDDETRAVVIHVFFDDMTREEAARMVGISVPTLRKRLDTFYSRARRRLGVAAVAAAVLALLAIYGGATP